LATGTCPFKKSIFWDKVSSKPGTAFPSLSTIRPVNVSKLLWINSWQAPSDSKRTSSKKVTPWLQIFLIYLVKTRERDKYTVEVSKTVEVFKNLDGLRVKTFEV
jgi:hypothetical protein